MSDDVTAISSRLVAIIDEYDRRRNAYWARLYGAIVRIHATTALPH